MVGILVVDINTTTSYRIRKILEGINVDISTATTTMETINRISSPDKEFDLVIIDIKLGSEDGYELINHILQMKKDLVICIVTAQNTRRSFVKGIKVGANDYVLKPFADEYLRQKLIYHINAIETSKAIPNTSPKAVDQAIYNAVKKAIREGYELLIGLFVLYHPDNESSDDIGIKDLAILKSFTHYIGSYISVDDELYSYSSNGAVIIMPKHKLEQKQEVVDAFSKLIDAFMISYSIKDSSITFDLISLPNEVDPKENAISVLAKRVEDKVK